MDKLKVFALDENMRRASAPIDYTTLLWSRRYYETGSFVLQIPTFLYDEKWKYIFSPDRGETGIIERVALADTELTKDSADTITISGRFMESLLDNFTFLVEETKTEHHYLHPPSPNGKRQTYAESKPAYISSGGYIYTYDSSGNLVGSPPANKDGVSETKYLAKTEQNADGSVTVTDLAGSTYTVQPIQYQQWENSFLYTSYPDDVDPSDEDYSKDLHYYQEFWDGSTLQRVYKSYIKDPTGGVWVYHDPADGYIEGSQGWFREVGVTDSIGDTYAFKMRAWQKNKEMLNAYRDESGYWVYDVEVKGPWQRTEIDDVGKEMDSVQQLILWVRMFFQNMLAYEEPDFKGEVKIINPSLKGLGELLRDELKTLEASYSLDYSFAEDACIFRIWKGKDRTQSQTENRWAVFSDTWGTLYSYVAARDISNYKNKCYVLYDAWVPVLDSNGKPIVERDGTWSDDGTLFTPTGWKLRTEHKRGYETVRLDDDMDDRECFLDLRGEHLDIKTSWTNEEGKPTFDGDWTNKVSAATDFYARGLEFLANEHPIANALDTGTLVPDDYLDKWDLGDRVDMAVNRVGMVKEARIVGVDESYSADDPSISIIIDDEITKVKEEADG